MKERRQVVQDLILFLRDFQSWNFSSCLFDLIGRADPSNQAKIALGFPLEVQVWRDWQNSENEEDFFKKELNND